MRHTLKRTLTVLLLSALILHVFILPLTVDGSGRVSAKTITGRVTAGILSVRKGASLRAKTIKVLHCNDRVRVLTTGKPWVKVQVGKKVGYTRGRFLATPYGGTADQKGGMSKGNEVARFALRFVGNPYEFGGTSLTGGTDCSGFVMSVYRHFGRSLPRTSSSQRGAGRSVASLSQAQPGDIICYNGHVAIYLGKGRIVHASNEREGIKITKNANYRDIVSIRRIF